MAEAKPEVHPDFNKKSSTSMEPKIAVIIAHIGALFSWVGLGWLSGLIIYLIEKENKFVKFHAMQSLVIGIVEVGVAIISWIVIFVTVGFGAFVCAPLLAIVLVATFVIRIVIVIKAYNGEYYKFPWFGVWAEKWMGKF